MRFGCGTLVVLSAMLAVPASAQATAQRSRRESPPVAAGAGNAAELFREQAAREMDERLARHERAGRRATSGICDGCVPGTRAGRRRIGPRETIGEDGLPFQSDP